VNSPAIAALAAALVLVPLALAKPAAAGDVQGDAYDCQELWVMRNQIYKDNGYCFKTKKARSYFGNGGCYVADQSDVSLSSKEMSLVLKYKHWDTVNGC
jgi:hypothetical protein